MIQTGAGEINQHGLHGAAHRNTPGGELNSETALKTHLSLMSILPACIYELN